MPQTALHQTQIMMLHVCWCRIEVIHMMQSWLYNHALQTENLQCRVLQKPMKPLQLDWMKTIEAPCCSRARFTAHRCYWAGVVMWSLTCRLQHQGERAAHMQAPPLLNDGHSHFISIEEALTRLTRVKRMPMSRTFCSEAQPQGIT